MLFLVVEDDAVTARIFVRTAGLLGHEAVVVPDPELAWERFLADDDIDVIVSRWLGQGEELCRRIRGAPGRYRPFFVLTAADERDLQRTAMQAGADDVLIKPLQVHDFELRLIRAERLVRLHRRLQTQADELRRLNSRFRHEGITDALTGIGNRKHFDEAMQTVHQRLVETGKGYSLGLIDCDHFKAYNDAHGHPAGDRLLQTVATVLRRGCRKGVDEVYRYGGEEFALVLQTAVADRAFAVLDRMRADLEGEAIAHPDHDEAVVTFSAGVVAVTDPAVVPETALESVDRALYAAKRGGRNRVERAALTSRRSRPSGDPSS